MPSHNILVSAIFNHFRNNFTGPLLGVILLQYHCFNYFHKTPVHKSIQPLCSYTFYNVADAGEIAVPLFFGDPGMLVYFLFRPRLRGQKIIRMTITGQ